MVDIFLSYASQDRERVLPLVEALQQDGFSIWWDRNIRPGPSFDREIESAIQDASCMIVVWSEYSIESEWVRNEIDEGVRRGILVPVFIDDVLPPLAYRRRQAANLTSWDGGRDGAYDMLLAGIDAVLEGKGQPDKNEQGTATATRSQGHPVDTPPSRRRASTTISKTKASMLAGICLLLGGGGIVTTWIIMRPEPSAIQPAHVIRFTIPVGEGAELYLGGERDTVWGRPSSRSLTLSNDGKSLIYSAWEEAADGRKSRLYVRRLDQERADPIVGSEGASNPFFSPDDAWIGFFVGSSIRRIPTAGGNVETIINDVMSTGRFGPRGATWGDDGTIVYGDYDLSKRLGGLYRVAASGGDAALVAEPDPETSKFGGYLQPHLVHGGRVLLFHGLTRTYNPEVAEIMALDLDTGTQKTLLTNAMDPQYAVETGQLLFVHQGSLMAVGFDPDRLALVGKPVIVLEDVMQALGMPNTGWETGAAQVAISSGGHLAYVQGGAYPGRTTAIMRVSLEGEAESLDSDSLISMSYAHPRLSPQGDRLAFDVHQGRGSSIYVHDLDRDVTKQLDTGGFANVGPSWSPDGQYIAFSSDREDNVANLYRMAADGNTEPERIAPSDQPQYMSSWSSEGVIAYLQGSDIWALPPDGEPAPLFTSEARETHVSFSPDGRWLAMPPWQR